MGGKARNVLSIDTGLRCQVNFIPVNILVRVCRWYKAKALRDKSRDVSLGLLTSIECGSYPDSGMANKCDMDRCGMSRFHIVTIAETGVS